MDTPGGDWKSLKTVALLGTYLPRRCGIATFTSDLAEALQEAAPSLNVRTVAMDDRPEGYRYPPRVWFELNQNRLGEYRLAADFLNLSHVDVLCVQHEYGIFGGSAGSHLFEMLRRMRMPVVTTMHTVLRDPEPAYMRATKELAELSDRLVVLSHRAGDFLRDVYDVPDEKIAFIPHGIPDVPFVDPAFYKDLFGVEGKRVILTFGLLGPSKGVENMIDALPHVVKKHPDVVYIVLGATHPHVKAHEGEGYRMSLQRRAADLGVGEQVMFHNRFVELRELCEFLGAADIYVTPYHNEAQAVSGTLAYALGAGKATISTPYWYAQEMLADERGRLVPFKDTKALADQVIHVLDNEVERHAMRKRAYNYTRSMVWPNVADDYLKLFVKVRQERQRAPRPLFLSRAFKDKEPELTELNLDHLRALTDDTGILQHAKANIPDRAFGYSTIDNAKALIAALIAQDYAHDQREANLLREIGIYLGFLQHAFDRDNKRFHAVMSYDRRWQPSESNYIDDLAYGQAIWALGTAVARASVRGHMALAVNLFQEAMPHVPNLTSTRAWAYSLIGIGAYLRRFSGDSEARRLREKMAERLFQQFKTNASDDWPWFEDKFTRASARFCQALLLSGQWMFRNDIIETALRSLNWLYEHQVTEDGYFQPIGSRGGWVRGQAKARFDQKPIEALAMIDACIEAYHVTSDTQWVDRAYTCLTWFLGENDLRQPLYDYATGGCCDGLHPQGVNENQGAESTLAWLLSLLTLYDHTHETTVVTKPGETNEGDDAPPAKFNASRGPTSLLEKRDIAEHVADQVEEQVGN